MRFHFSPLRPQFGTPGPDVLDLGKGRDLFFGLDGDDVLSGGVRTDILFGGTGNDVLLGGKGRDLLIGEAGNDRLDGGDGADILIGGDGLDMLAGGAGRDLLLGDAGADTLDGGHGNDVLIGGLGIDRLTGGQGQDIFVFGADAITDVSTTLLVNVAGTGIDVKVSADAITDFDTKRDKIALDLEEFSVTGPIVFDAAVTAELGDANFIVQLDGFANVALAASAIAANEAVTADAGFFIYFNTSLGFNRLVYSEDLGDAGDVTVLANFVDQTGPEGLAAIAQFGASDFLFT